MYLNLVSDVSGDLVKIETKTKHAVQLFHSINRVVSLLDMLRVNEDGMILDPNDQHAYDQLTELAEVLQRELNIDPDVTEEL